MEKKRRRKGLLPMKLKHNWQIFNMGDHRDTQSSDKIHLCAYFFFVLKIIFFNIF
jgi:hypothetical protein